MTEHLRPPGDRRRRTSTPWRNAKGFFIARLTSHVSRRYTKAGSPREGGGAMRALELIGVEKRFKKRKDEGVKALNGVSLAVERGEVVGILGPNGSGKSTLVRVVSTLILPDAGQVRVFGVDAVAHPKTVQRFINRVSVEASFFKKLSAMENLLYGAMLYGLTAQEARPRILT